MTSPPVPTTFAGEPILFVIAINVKLGLSDGINIEIKEGVALGDKLRGGKKSNEVVKEE